MVKHVNEKLIDLKSTDKKFSQQYLSMGILALSVMIGLLFNWISFYLSIVLGFLSIGVGPLIILLLAKLAYRKKELTKSHLALISIAYRGTTAAEASTGLLFVIWLTVNSRLFYNLDFNPPSWFLPSASVLSNRSLGISEWFIGS